MRSFETTSNLKIDIQITDTGVVLLVIDGEPYKLSSSDSMRIAENLKEAGSHAEYQRCHNWSGKVTGPFA